MILESQDHWALLWAPHSLSGTSAPPSASAPPPMRAHSLSLSNKEKVLKKKKIKVDRMGKAVIKEHMAQISLWPLTSPKGRGDKTEGCWGNEWTTRGWGDMRSRCEARKILFDFQTSAALLGPPVVARVLIHWHSWQTQLGSILEQLRLTLGQGLEHIPVFFLHLFQLDLVSLLDFLPSLLPLVSGHSFHYTLSLVWRPALKWL